MSLQLHTLCVLGFPEEPKVMRFSDSWSLVSLSVMVRGQSHAIRVGARAAGEMIQTSLRMVDRINRSEVIQAKNLKTTKTIRITVIRSRAGRIVCPELS